MKRLISAAIAFGVASVLAAACTTHGSGGRCDPGNVPAGTNQNADCDNGLTCIPGLELELPDGGGHPSGYFCCPPDQDRASLPLGDICALNPVAPGSDASIPDSATESGPGDASTDQASGDAATDATDDVVQSDASDAASTDASGE